MNVETESARPGTRCSAHIGLYALLLPPSLGLPSLAAAQTCSTATPTPTAETWTESKSTVNGARINIFTGPTDHGSSLAITSGIDKSLWVTLTADAAIMKISTGGAAEIYPTPTPDSSPEAIVEVNGKDMWFSEWGTGCVGSITAKGKITEYSTGLSETNSVGMTTTDKEAWFTTDYYGIGKVTEAGKVHLYSFPDDSSQPTAITLGPDGNLWFVEAEGNNVGKITPEGEVKEYNVGFNGFSNSFGIAAGSDGRIWFADPGNSIPRIGAIKTDGSGLTYYSAGLTGEADSIVAGPDGNLYFGEFGGVVGRITTAGVITEFPLPMSEGSFPVLSLTVGPDGNIWFSNNSHSQVGELKLPVD
jgi:streptogramin lyase